MFWQLGGQARASARIYAEMCDLDGWTWKGPLVLEWSLGCLKKFFLQKAPSSHSSAPDAQAADSGLGAASREALYIYYELPYSVSFVAVAV